MSQNTIQTGESLKAQLDTHADTMLRNALDVIGKNSAGKAREELERAFSDAVEAQVAYAQYESRKECTDKKNWYWELNNGDGEQDGFIHIVSTVNGRELKIDLSDIFYGKSKG